MPATPGAITELKPNEQGPTNTSTLPDINSPKKTAATKLQLNARNEIVTCNMNNIIKYEEFCNLKVVKDYFDSLNSKGKSINSILFEGIEVVTDLVFYLFYKYYKGSHMWSMIEEVTLDSCRFLSDFGLELLVHATEKPALVSHSNTNGCKNVLKYRYHGVQLDRSFKDLFSCPSFTKLAIPNAESMPLNSYKVIVINETRFDITHSISQKSDSKEKQKPQKRLFDYSQIHVGRDEQTSSSKEQKDQLTLNVFEVDSVNFNGFNIFF